MSIINLMKDVENLVSPLAGESLSTDDIFGEKINHLYPDLAEISDIDTLLASKFTDFKIKPSWLKFTKILLSKLICLKNEVSKDTDHLFSLGHQKTLRSSLEIIICLGILPHLNKGIGVPVNQRLINKNYSLLMKDVTTEEKYYSLNLTLLGLYDLLKSENFNSVLTNNYLGDIMAGTVQVIIEKETVDPKLFKNYLQELVEKTYQPLVIRSLIVMAGNKDKPKVLGSWLNNTLSERLTSGGGLVATLRAILDMSGNSKDTPQYWDHISVLARLFTLPKHASVYPQLLDLIKGQESDYRQVAVMSLKVLSEVRPIDAEKYFIAPLLATIISPSSETECSKSLEAIHACLGIQTPCSVSPTVIASTFHYFIRLNTRLKKSVSYLKSKTADIAWAILSHEETNLEETFLTAIFTPLPIMFALGSEGGVYVKEGPDDLDLEDVADSILELFLSRGNATAKVKVFKMLITCIIKDESLEKQLIYSKLLSDLCADNDVQKSLSEEPFCIIPFIKVLLENPQSYGNETVCLGLMVLGIVIDTPFSHKPIDWSELNVLVEPLKNFKSSSTETNVLANELYELILSRGVVRKKPKKVEEVKTSAEKALEEAVDPLLPVRAHGIRELGKLLLIKDKQAMKKKETILFILKENLKDEDSYVYLSSVEGLAALSASFPDEVLITLVEEYNSEKHMIEDRLKVGEVLIKVARHLNEMAIVYKKELVSCFLVGCRSEDPLMRASSLSNLGEISKILSYRITSFILEILECVRSIYETDKHPEPRRAAVMVLTLLIKGLHREGSLSTIEPVLLPIYRSLKNAYQYDKDDITRLHAQLALEELRALTLGFLNPQVPLEKKIFVLDPPM